MLKRLAFRPLVWALLVIAACAGWYARPLDRSALFPVRFSNDTFGYVTANGRVALRDAWSFACDFDAGGMARVELRGKKAYINRYGNIVIPPSWDSLWYFHDDDTAEVE